MHLVLDFLVNLHTLLVDAVVGGDAHLVALGTQVDGSGLHFLTREGSLQDALYLAGLGRLVELHHVVAATGEIDALAEATCQHEAHAGHSQDGKDGEAGLPGTHELIGRVLEELAGQGSGEGDVEPLVLGHATLEYHACHEDSGKEAHDDTDDERSGETTDRTCTEVEEDDTRDDRGQVGVEDGTEGIAVTSRESLLYALAALELFFRTLIDKYVGIHGHTQ